MNLSVQIKKYTKELGFHIVKIIPAVKLLKEGEYFKEWLKKGFSADLDYMQKEPEKRYNPEKILKNAKSIICLGMNYYQEMPKVVPRDSGIVARYAWGKDYHFVIEKKLKKIRKFIAEKTGANKTDFKLYSDAGPVLDRAYAAKAGLGFIGKNTSLITKEFGSWVFLAEIITTLKFDYDNFSEEEEGAIRALSCGTCTKCIDSCPTKALTGPYCVDANKCISYLTIESKAKIPLNMRKKIGNRIFGCDICQEVCPHNCRAKKTDVKEFLTHISGPFINIKELKKMSVDEIKVKFAGSPVKRSKNMI